MEAAHVTIDLSHLPDNFIYGQHYRFAVFILPSRCKSELCDSNRVRLTPKEYLPCKLPKDFSIWFSDPSVPKNVMNNFTIYALDDLIFRVEVHILYGLFINYEKYFLNSSSVTIMSPSRAKSQDGIANPEMRRLSQYISFEERYVKRKFFFGALYKLSLTESVSQPLNMPPRYSAYERGRALIMYNTSQDGDIPLILDPYEIANTGTDFWNMPVPTVAETKEQLDAYFETFHEMENIGAGQYNFNFQQVLLPYFPYFSNCYGYDSYIPIWMITEDPVGCKLSKQLPKKHWRRKAPPLPDQDNINSIGPFDIFANPIADVCKVIFVYFS